MDKFMSEQRSRLLKQKEELLGIQRTLNEGLREAMRDSISELSMYDNEPADIGSELFEREKDFALEDNVRTGIIEIDSALKRIQDGTYGTCASCGKPIPRERLEAAPEATQCIECKNNEEQHNNQVYSGSLDIAQSQLPELMKSNHDSAEVGDPVDFPNIYDDWDQYNGWVEPYENLEVEFDQDTGMFVAKNPPQADVNMKENRANIDLE